MNGRLHSCYSSSFWSWNLTCITHLIKDHYMKHHFISPCTQKGIHSLCGTLLSLISVFVCSLYKGVPKITRLTHKIVIHLHTVAESCTI